MFKIIENIVYNETVPYKDNISSLSLWIITLFAITTFFSFFTNFLNIIIFSNPQMKDSSFIYLQAISISNFLYASFLAYGGILFCNDCYFNFVYETQIYRIIMYYIFSNGLNMFSALCDLVISLHHYFILKNKNFLKDTSHKWILLGFVVFSILSEGSILFSYDIQMKFFIANDNFTFNEQVAYSTVLNSFGGKIFYVQIIESAVKIFIHNILLSIISLFNMFEFHKRYSQKGRIKNRPTTASKKFNLYLFKKRISSLFI